MKYLKELIKPNEQPILDLLMPGGDNWREFERKQSSRRVDPCKRSCPGFTRCKGNAPDRLLCSTEWKRSLFTDDNLNILFHVLNEFDHYNRADLDTLSRQSPAIKRLRARVSDARVKIAETTSDLPKGQEQISFIEGKQLTRMHLARERNPRLAAAKKQIVLAKTGKLACEVCGFDSEETYGDIGRGLAECHHNRPLSTLRRARSVTVAELSILCANCHRAIHRTKPLTSIARFRKRFHHILKR